MRRSFFQRYDKVGFHKISTVYRFDRFLGSRLVAMSPPQSGATTLVEDGVEGIIIRAQGPRHLADALIQVLLDPDLNRKMGEAALEKGVTKNTCQEYDDRILDAYLGKLSH